LSQCHPPGLQIAALQAAALYRDDAGATGS
jgi:hypothetical protein